MSDAGCFLKVCPTETITNGIIKFAVSKEYILSISYFSFRFIWLSARFDGYCPILLPINIPIHIAVNILWIHPSQKSKYRPN